MKKWILKPGADLDAVIDFLEDRLLYATEMDGEIEVFVADDQEDSPWIERTEPYVLPETDWEQDWAHHVPLKEGILEIALQNKIVKMRPGPGFGNVSHPTTQLMLEAMTPLCKGKRVLDVGTGSGILALAASLLGATAVSAVDIDPEAIRHAQENAELNGCNIDFSGNPKAFDLMLLNMIFSEQKEALKAYPFNQGTLLTSGILQEERAPYLTFAQAQGWKLEHLYEKEGWLAFRFQNM